MSWNPGPSYYIWLRWIFRSGNKISPPDPKPWVRLERKWIDGPDGKPTLTWKAPKSAR